MIEILVSIAWMVIWVWISVLLVLLLMLVLVGILYAGSFRDFKEMVLEEKIIQRLVMASFVMALVSGMCSQLVAINITWNWSV